MKKISLTILASTLLCACALDRPISSLPYTPSLDLSSMDRSSDPCADFYQYSCGGWVKNNPIPPDQSAWSVYAKLASDNQRFLWGILDDLADRGSGRSVPQQKIGDYFASCMDERAVEKKGAAALRPELDAIAGLTNKLSLAPLLARVQAMDDTSGFLFGFGSNQDFENSESVIAFATAGGLGLPDRDYYTKTDPKSRQIRDQYTAHMQRMFVLLGDVPAVAHAEAVRVMEIETSLAGSSLTLVQKRDPHRLVHKRKLRGLKELTPSFDWSIYLAALGLAGLDSFNVTEPEFFREVDRQLRTRDLDDLKAYLRWHVAHANAAYLSTAFVNEDFDFYGRTMRGTQQLRPRWKRCVALVDQQLGEALGQEFVARAFTPELKAKTLQMTTNIEQAMQQDLEHLDWMSPATRKRALEKLHAVVNKIGYPDHWRDYGTVQIRRDDFLGNQQRTTTFESQRQLAKIGKPVDRTEWVLTPPTVNAGYEPQTNDITFPAGVLQPPLFDGKLDDAPNYGNTGGTIGHELTHGFDDEGRQFDAHGNLRDWWTPRDAKAFNSRAQCVVHQYGQYTAIDELKINSELTEGEDIADLGGEILAYMAWKIATQGQQLKDQDGMTPDQRFFVGFAQWACESVRPERARELAQTNPHSPGKYRINGVAANMPEFQKAFSCKAGAPMVNAKPCRVW